MKINWAKLLEAVQEMTEELPQLALTIKGILDKFKDAMESQPHLMQATHPCSLEEVGCFDSLVDYQTKALVQTLLLHHQFCPHHPQPGPDA